MKDLDFSEFEMDVAEPDAVAPAQAEGPAPVVEGGGMAGARVYHLLVPRKVDGKWLRRVVIRLPEQTDLDDFALGVLANRRALLCRLTGLHPVVIGKLVWPDSEAVHQIFADLIPAFLKD